MNALFEFEKIVDYIYGVYLDATTGFSLVRKQIEDQQKIVIQLFKITHPELANVQHLDNTAIIYGKGDPNTPEAIKLHRCTQLEYKDRNGESGSNFKFIGNMSLISLYQYWEDYYRSKVAKLFGIRKNELLAPIMGDLRRLRISIIHHAGDALKDVEQCEVLNWYKENDNIFIDKEKFEQIIFHVKNQINEYKSQLSQA